jgi:hypothetical protein
LDVGTVSLPSEFTMIVDCPKCRAIVDAKELQHHYMHDDLAPTVRVTFAACPKCDSPFLGQALEDFIGYEQAEQLFPALQSRLPEGIPPTIAAAYSEIQKCFRASAFTAAAIMCRKTLEGVCAEHGVQERNLAASLRAMKDSGAIENRLFEWADALRISGNEAAHSVELTTTPEDARDLLDFTTALIEYLFTFRDRFEQFKARRTARDIDS